MDRAQEIGLFRYSAGGRVASTRRSRRGSVGCWCGRWRRGSTSGPDGRWVRVSRTTLDRWIRAYRQGGFEALVPAPRRVRDQHAGAAVGAGVRAAPRAAGADGGADPQDHRGGGGRVAVGADDPASLRGGRVAVEGRGRSARALGRFEAERRNELWTGDALHGPLVDGRSTFLFCFIDDHSRLLAGYRWAAREDVLNASGRCGPGSPRAACRRPSTSTTVSRSCPGSCCGRARCSGSG